MFGREMAGYSATPLVQKLGIRAGVRVLIINAPNEYEQLVADLPEGARLSRRITAPIAFVHLFVRHRAEVEKQLKVLRPKLSDSGTLWVSWPKKSAGIATDVTEDTIREAALPLGLVDTKVCAVNDVWSALKLVIRQRNRKSAQT